jgi:hypothetical protein
MPPEPVAELNAAWKMPAMSTLYPAPLHAPAAALPEVVERDQPWSATCHAADGVRPSPTAATVAGGR